MKKLLSTSYTDWAFNLALLILRVVLGVLMIPHGYGKLVNFGSMQHKFMNFLGMGSTLSLTLTIFAEFFCAMFVVLGLFTRFSVLPLIVAMCVAVFKAHNADFFGDGEKGTLYLAGLLVILLVGPGRISVDAATGK